jgi:DNA-binding MarR family transcriptional regulator
MDNCDKEFSLDFLGERIQRVKSLLSNAKGIDEKQIISCRLLYELSENMQQEIDNHMSEYGLVGEAWIVLMIVCSSTEGKLIANDICCHLGKNKSTTSRIVESLIQKKFLIRIPDENDRRQIFLHITEEGKKFINENIDSHIRYHKELWKGVDIDLFLKQIIQLHLNSKQAKMK